MHFLGCELSAGLKGLGGDKSQPPDGLTAGDAAQARWCLAMDPLVGSAGFEGSHDHSWDFLQKHPGFRHSDL